MTSVTIENKPNFIQCPKCKGFIPDFWKKHDKCGWKAETVENAPAIKNGIQDDMRKSINDSKTLMKEFPDMPMDWSAVSITMFIERHRR